MHHTLPRVYGGNRGECRPYSSLTRRSTSAATKSSTISCSLIANASSKSLSSSCDSLVEEFFFGELSFEVVLVEPGYFSLRITVASNGRLNLHRQVQPEFTAAISVNTHRACSEAHQTRSLAGAQLYYHGLYG